MQQDYGLIGDVLRIYSCDFYVVHVTTISSCNQHDDIMSGFTNLPMLKEQFKQKGGFVITLDKTGCMTDDEKDVTMPLPWKKISKMQMSSSFLANLTIELTHIIDASDIKTPSSIFIIFSYSCPWRREGIPSNRHNYFVRTIDEGTKYIRTCFRSKMLSLQMSYHL